MEELLASAYLLCMNLIWENIYEKKRIDCFWKILQMKIFFEYVIIQNADKVEKY